MQILMVAESLLVNMKLENSLINVKWKRNNHTHLDGTRCF